MSWSVKATLFVSQSFGCSVTTKFSKNSISIFEINNVVGNKVLNKKMSSQNPYPPTTNDPCYPSLPSQHFEASGNVSYPNPSSTNDPHYPSMPSHAFPDKASEAEASGNASYPNLPSNGGGWIEPSPPYPAKQ